jgi:Double sensory domain of two-component sensor kinase
MHRSKIGLIAAGLLLIFTVIVYSAVTSSLTASATREVEEKVARAQRVHQQISRLGGLDLANLAVDGARRPGVLAALGRGDETGRRQAAFEECELINAALQKESRRADVVAVLDGQGKVVARDLNPNANWGDDLGANHPAVQHALRGQAVKDVWTLQNRMTEVALAPVTRPDGGAVGALLLGYVVSNRKAQERRDLLGTEIGFFHDGKVRTSSFVSEETGDSAKEAVGQTQALATVLFQGPRLAEQALQKNAPTPIHHFSIEGTDYAAVAAPLPGNFADRTSGVLILSSLSDERARAREPGRSVILFGLLAIIVALGAAVMTAKRFIGPLDQIELGVGEVINGNIDYTFKPVGPDFEGLSNSLNVMLARLLGRDEPNEDAVEEEETEVEKWRADSMIIDEGDGAPSPGAAALGLESEASYYPRLFNEYVTALKASGKTADGVSVPTFMAKLRLAEAGLKQKWGCRMVRCQLVASGDQIVFRAVRID